MTAFRIVDATDAAGRPLPIGVADGLITAGDERDGTLDAAGLIVAPGFIDLQVNGGHGHDFTVAPDGIWDVAARLPETGVTSFLPTVITAAPGAIEAARARNIDVEGPVAPDTAFTQASRESSDAVVCMYHDQGHIPVKAIAFDKAVNTTLGLPFPRTSVDHGTAYDIAWKGEADPSSLFEAVKLAAQLAES